MHCCRDLWDPYIPLRDSVELGQGAVSQDCWPFCVWLGEGCLTGLLCKGHVEGSRLEKASGGAFPYSVSTAESLKVCDWSQV